MAADLERERAALDALESRRDEYLAAILHARETNEPEQVLRLTEQLAPFLHKRSYWDDGERVFAWAVDAARLTGNAAIEARMRNELGTLLARAPSGTEPSRRSRVP